MPCGCYRIIVLRGKHSCVLLFLPTRAFITCVLLVLMGVYRVPRLTHACTVHSCITCKRFPLAFKSIKNM